VSLEKYRKKRRFDRTPEPAPSKARKRDARAGRRFVIHEHHARRLHWDLRLEHRGVLLSWAVPKGPSLDPKARRLAVQTEDHPLEYGDFEGTIPKGEYGAGSVAVWDEGRWEPDGDPDEGLREGHLRFTLDGRRLHGGFSLIRTGVDKGGKASWMLVKRKDDEAVPGDADGVVTAHPGSVRAGRASRVRREAEALEGAVTRPVPWPLPPFLAEPGPPVRGTGWLHEIKWDGYRLLARVDAGKVELRTRHGRDLAHDVPGLVEELAALPHPDLVLDGELVWLRADGHSDFGRLQRARGRDDPHLHLLVFDVIGVAGVDLRNVALRDRKRLLKALVDDGERIRRVDAVEGSAASVLERACALGLEGIVSKRADGAYRAGRHPDWTKTRCTGSDTFVVGGWRRRSGELASLLLGRREPDGTLRYVGGVGTGMSERERRATQRLLEPLSTDDCPFASRPDDATEAVWVRPELQVDVKYGGWTHGGRLRHASFAGPVQAPPAATPRSSLPTVRLTHPDRVLFPDVGVTKRDLVLHYARVAHLLLPHVGHRRLSLVRCPEGLSGSCFFQRHHRGLPDTVRSTPSDDPDEGPIPWIDDVDGLIGLVQHGVIELHPAGSRVDRHDRPDRLVFDLDPDEALPWEDVVAAARDVRAFLADLGLASFARSTGGKGLHVVVPITRRVGWETVRQFCRAVAEQLVAAEPDRFVATSTKRLRKGRIFLDHLRNAPQATAVGSWVVRARPGAPVAVPMPWEDLDAVPPGGFTITTVELPRRDPWADIDEAAVSLTAKVLRAVGAEKVD
jgi:bifunctional non-homologous end joining protein LigD